MKYLQRWCKRTGIKGADIKCAGLKGLGVIVSFVAGVYATQGYGMTYGASLEDSVWHVKGNELECGLTQDIPEFGAGVFTKKAGEQLAFYLKPFDNPMQPGVAILSAEGPAWKPQQQTLPIAEVEVSDDSLPVQVGFPHAQQMLLSLKRGLMPTILSGEDPSALDTVKVEISSVNFQQAYQDYVACLTGLLPVNFDQIARSAIFFNTNKSVLSEDVREQLDLIARYIKADKRVKRVFIDGHTDDRGNKKINRNLSKRRAEMVAGYFKKAGVNDKLLVSRYHADKYPALKNETDENRARNRRVTIRLERE